MCLQVKRKKKKTDLRIPRNQILQTPQSPKILAHYIKSKYKIYGIANPDHMQHGTKVPLLTSIEAKNKFPLSNTASSSPGTRGYVAFLSRIPPPKNNKNNVICVGRKATF